MKPLRAGIAIILLAVAVHGFGGERSLIWSRLYRRARTLEDKMNILDSAARRPTADLSPMLLDAIDELNAMREQVSTTTDTLLHVRLSTKVVQLLGEIGVSESAPYIHDVVQNSSDPFLKGEALYALGRIGADGYAVDIAMLLRNLNLNLDTGIGKRDAEIVAFGAVLALERLREPVGYAPLFFASIGWYSPASGVKEKAEEVMFSLIEDPTEVLLDIVKLESDTEVKLKALLAESRSGAPASGVTRVAEESLRQSLLRRPISINEETVLSQMRLLSMELLVSHGGSSGSLDNLIEVATGASFNINERITAINAIAAEASENAVSALILFLRKQNERQQSGITPADYRIIRATIQMLGQLGDGAAVEELLAVGISDWPQAIERDAARAIADIEGQ